jgi:hypothetical protein
MNSDLLAGLNAADVGAGMNDSMANSSIPDAGADTYCRRPRRAKLRGNEIARE